MFYNLSRLFDYDSDLFSSVVYSTKYTSSNIKEDDKKYTVRLDVPGFTGKEINLTVKDNILYIKGKLEDDGDWSSSTKSFAKSYTLPSFVDQDNIEADVKNGVLVVRIPKQIEKKLGKTIQVKTL